MKRWLPYPIFSVSLFATWLVLNETAAPGHLLLGALFAFAGGRIFAALQAPAGRLRIRATAVAQLAWLVFADIVRSNVAVARIVLHPGMAGRTSGFLTMPLEVRHPGALAVLACIVTATPGTSWAGYDAERNTVIIHVLDLVDEHAWVAQFKARYEERLKEIFL